MGAGGGCCAQRVLSTVLAQSAAERSKAGECVADVSPQSVPAIEGHPWQWRVKIVTILKLSWYELFLRLYNSPKLSVVADSKL